jgi:putative redox protein
MHDLSSRIARLGRPLMVMHSPIDPVVGIDNASTIFLAAKHPKSFVSLDEADHLLTRAEDAEWAAQVIAAWARRYIGAETEAEVGMEPPAGAVLVEETGAGKFQVEVRAGGEVFTADEPVEVGGLGSGPSPYQLLAAGLGACTAMTVRLYAERKGWRVERTRVLTRHERVADAAPPDLFERRIAFEGDLDAVQKARLFEIADKCPVHRTLEGGSRITTSPLEAPPPAAARAGAEEHFRDMDEVCRQD